MNFEQWKAELAAELGKAFDMNGFEYIRQTGEKCWREMFDDDPTPAEAAREEVWAAQSML